MLGRKVSKTTVIALFVIVSVALFATAFYHSGFAATLDIKHYERRVRIRWLGLGVVELSTPDYKKIVYIDALIINNWGFAGFNIPVPTEYSSMENWVNYIKGKSPSVVIFTITHNHGDHVGNLLDCVGNLTKDNNNIKVAVVAQYELATLYLGPKLEERGVNPSEVIVTGGMGINIGGTTVVDGVSITATRAVHSSAEIGAAGTPMGYVIQINDVTIYASGDTDIFEEMKFIGDFYKPDLAFVCIGDTFTMGPKVAAVATKYINPDTVIPYHYGLSPPLLGPEAAETFKNELWKLSHKIKVVIIRPGDTFNYTAKKR
ncbi:MAG: metal-dependent hydrolase [Candidatus Bathyarchaeia archaeon]